MKLHYDTITQSYVKYGSAAASGISQVFLQISIVYCVDPQEEIDIILGLLNE